MSKFWDLFRGFRGHPLHPPLTDASIGAYYLGSLAVLIGWLRWVPDWLESKLYYAGFIAIAAGLAFAIPTVFTGLLDYIKIPRGTGMRRVANAHWVLMVLSTSAYLVAEAMLQQSFDGGRITGLAASVTLFALILLTGGGYLGGTLVFEYGMRVLNTPAETPAGETLKPKWPPD